ncbi:MAG: type II toxin-antitoxin system RelB/DinJ family antitoxin [Selenomonadaceae bacterium]|nr:type II toxin-antitoxin system RelB/DinJ family antitoxin [Selenomonadaceae bacterium]
MATKTATLYARMEPEVKEEAEHILAALGMSASNAITLFYKQIILQRGLPFSVKLPPARPLSLAGLTDEELGCELQKGYDDLAAGHTKPAHQVFAEIRKDYGL